MAWQPIDTAPTDGTELLLWDGRQRFVGRCRSGLWYATDVADEHHSFADPTHWQALPAPPAGTPEQQSLT